MLFYCHSDSTHKIDFSVCAQLKKLLILRAAVIRDELNDGQDDQQSELDSCKQVSTADASQIVVTNSKIRLVGPLRATSSFVNDNEHLLQQLLFPKSHPSRCIADSRFKMNILLWRIFAIILLFVGVISSSSEVSTLDAPVVSTKTYLNGDSYEGEMDDNGLRNGKGILRWSGMVYDGDWLADKRHGKGIWKIDGDIYEGEFKDDIMHGKGKYTWSYGDIYDGEFRDGLFHGKGIFIWTDGSFYSGDFKDDQRHGNGTYTYADGTVYDGEYRDGLMHGKGKYTWPNGNFYDGMWLNDKRDGIGTQTSVWKLYPWWKLYQYQGEWSDDKKHGKGVISLFGNLVECEGEWRNGWLTNVHTNVFVLLQKLTKVIRHYLDILYHFGLVHVLVAWMCFCAFCRRRELQLANAGMSLDTREDDMEVVFRLDQDHTNCGICYKAFTTDIQSSEQLSRELLPVLGSCGHYFCHGCIIRCRFMVGLKGSVGCPKCVKADQFVPADPIHHRMLIDLLQRARPIGKTSSDERVQKDEGDDVSSCENEYTHLNVNETGRLFGFLLLGFIFIR